MGSEMRLQRFMASCGVASRRESERIILAGRVKVNGRTAELGDSIDPEKDKILLDGQPIKPETFVYILFHKPAGIITSARDTHARKTVIDHVANIDKRVFPVGRLDLDAEGVLLLTNDGELAHRLTHPSHNVEKTYVARVRGAIRYAEAMSLEEGVELDDGPTAPAKVRILSVGKTSSKVRVTIHEGRKREVKRMFAKIGYPVMRLKRTRFANLGLEGLPVGQWRRLHRDEINALGRLVGLRRLMRSK